MTEDKNKYILSINGMSKSFGRNKVLKGINMNVKPGTIMGLMGENGAGKSTMMKCLFGTYQKDEGTIILDGKEVNFSGPIIVVSSEMPEILGITNRIGVMSNGRLAGIVNTKETDQEELLRLSAKYL